MPTALPIDAVRDRVMSALTDGPVVLSAPTGSGKSTQVPRWLRASGRVLVVEPRRVAARALAARVAELEGCTLGDAVGYAVRDERRSSARTAVLFVTPGVALRMLRSGDDRHYATLVLDEFHERSLDLDLLLALVLARGRLRPLVMSATLAGDRIAAHLGGQHIAGEGRLYPVEQHYIPGRAEQPDPRGLESRVQAALDRAASDPGDVLVFLPGKGEIASVGAHIRVDAEVLALHGGLTLAEQSRIFSPGRRRRVILSTNVAETSLTVPRVGVVIDAGLARRTEYHHGRGYLTLKAIARDSAAQRAGRAGRLGPGVCYRLWPERYPLDASTPPEIYRESLVPLVLASSACAAAPETLPFLDPPREYALSDAREQLRELGALDDAGGLTVSGEDLFGLPLDAHLGRLLIEARRQDTLSMVIPLVAALSVPRRLLARRPQDPDHDLQSSGCDAVALITAVRRGKAGLNGLDPVALSDARHVARRLRRLWSMPDTASPIDRAALARTLLAAWPRCAHVVRRRRRAVAWSCGSTELSLGRDCSLNEEKTDALLVLDSRALGLGHRKRQLIITAAMPVPPTWLAQAGLGRDRLGHATLRNGTLTVLAERVYAGAVIASREESPVGGLAREAIRDLILRERLFPDLLPTLRQRHAMAGLAAQLTDAPPLAPLADWLLDRLHQLGLESAEDLALLEPDDLLPAAPDAQLRARITRHFPLNLSIGDATYRIAYDVSKRAATMHQVGGQRKTPPPERYLPALPGWTLLWEYKNRIRTLQRR